VISIFDSVGMPNATGCHYFCPRSAVARHRPVEAGLTARGRNVHSPIPVPSPTFPACLPHRAQHPLPHPSPLPDLPSLPPSSAPAPLLHTDQAPAFPAGVPSSPYGYALARRASALRRLEAGGGGTRSTIEGIADKVALQKFLSDTSFSGFVQQGRTSTRCTCNSVPSKARLSHARGSARGLRAGKVA